MVFRRIRRSEPATPSPDASPDASANPSANPSAKPAVDWRLTRQYWRVVHQVLGRDAAPDAWRDLQFDPDQAAQLTERLRLRAAFARFGELVARGDDPETAHIAVVRALISAGEGFVARSYSLGLTGQTPDDRVSRLGLALCLQRMGREHAAWDQLEGLDTDFLIRYAPVETVSAAFADGRPEAHRVAREIAIDPGALETGQLAALAGRYLVAGHDDRAQALYAEAGSRDDVDDWARRQLDNLSRWLGAPTPTPPDVVAGRVRLGVFDYYQPELVHAAGNIGDHVQTLALLANLVRFQEPTIHGARGLGELATELQARVRPGLRLDCPAVDVELVPVSRDYSEGDPVPEDTWLIAFGWHLHALFKIRYGLPYHPNLQPIFVAFHLNRVRALTPEVVEYLREHSPIGCRDHTTVDLLLSAGVDAFFTGCLTSTVDAVFPEREDVPVDERTVVAAIDVPARSVTAKRPVEEVTHYVEDWHENELVDGLRNADALLNTYQRRYHRIVTSRLHSYLPATALGVPVNFRPKAPGDVRFSGLLDMKPDAQQFVAMRDDIRDLLAETFSMILGGAAREEVRTRWRELTASRVVVAKERLAAPPAPVDGGLDVGAAVAAVQRATHRVGPHDEVDPDSIVDVAVSADSNYRHLLPVTLESLVSNATSPVRVFVTARGLDAEYRAWLGSAYPAVPFVFLDHDDVDYGPINRMLGHASVATMDRLLLPEVLSDINRIIYVDIDTVTLSDISSLAALDLEGHPLAARTEHYSATMTWRSVANHLDPTDAHELRRTMAAAHPFDFHTFNAGVLVLDLGRMRRDRFVERFVPFGCRYGLHDQDVLNAYAGVGRAELPQGWNTMPVVESVPQPHLIHYAGAGKPWRDTLVPGGRYWRTYADQFRDRVGAVPGDS